MKKILTLLTLFIFISAVQAKDLRFVQISDVRFAQNGENQILENVIDDVNKQKNVEFVVFTGDNIEKPSVDNLKGFITKAKKLKCPFYVIIGDKDVSKHKHLGKTEYIEILNKHIKKYKQEKPYYSFEKDDIIFVVADGAKEVIPSTNGYYKDDVLDWLDKELTKYNKKNVIILQHFPIIPPSERETYYTFKPENYLKILARHNNVKAVISGHFGINSEQTVNGAVHITTAGIPYYRIIDVMNCETQNPDIWAQLKKVE